MNARIIHCLFLLVNVLLSGHLLRGQESLPIIDCHVHLYDISRPEITWPPKGHPVLYRSFLPKNHMPICEKNGVVGVVVVLAGQAIEDNQWNLDVTAPHKKLYRGVVGNLSTVIGTDEFEELFRRLCQNERYVGYRLSGKQTPLNAEFFQNLRLTAQENRTVDILLGQYTLKEVDTIATKVPNLKIIIDHLGGVRLGEDALDPQWKEDMVKVAKHPNVFCKLSALYGRFKEQPAPLQLSAYSYAIDVAYEAFGEDRLIYGSDWPVTEQTADYQSALALTQEYLATKSKAARRKIFHDNAILFYGIPDLEKAKGTP